MPADDFADRLRDLVWQVAAAGLGASARIRVDLHPSRETEARTVLAGMPAGLPPVGLQLDEQCPPGSLRVRPWWPAGTRPVPAEAPVVLVTPTIGSGTVVRWYASTAAADNCLELVSASRDGVIGGAGQYLTPDVFAAAWAAHLSLKAGRRVDALATHRRPGVFALRPVVPV